jgi:phosphatidylinositol-3-phosphatase
MNRDRRLKRALIFFVAASVLCVFETGCGGGASTSQAQSNPSQISPPTQPPPPPPPPPTYDNVPHFGHVALVVFENQKADGILHNPNMPYLSHLAQQNAYAANYFADTHPSLGDYFVLTTGQIISNDLGFNDVVDQDNLVRQLNAAGKTWKAYEESLPEPGYLADDAYPYVKTHNPAAYFSDVHKDPAQAANIVPLDQLQMDMAAGNLPQFMFIEPNQINSTHDCPPHHHGCNNDFRLMVGDNWAQQQLGALLNDPVFQQDGLLIITWDESWDTDSRFGGGHVLAILVGPNVKKPYVSNTFFQHSSTLRTICDAVQIPCMGNATTAPPMSDFFAGN